MQSELYDVLAYVLGEQLHQNESAGSRELGQDRLRPLTSRHCSILNGQRMSGCLSSNAWLHFHLKPRGTTYCEPVSLLALQQHSQEADKCKATKQKIGNQ